jgi:hypothetical protein
MGLAVTPLTAAVLASVPDADLGEASAINDAASRVGGVITIAVVPALIGTGGGTLANALVHGYQPAMVALGGLCAAAALVTGAFVTGDRAKAPPIRVAPPAPHHGCAIATRGQPVRDLEQTTRTGEAA